MSEEYLDKKKNEAIAYYEMKRYEQAETAMKEVLSENPGDIAVRYLLANCYYMLDKYEEAENICHDITTTYLSAKAFRLLGKIARGKKQFKDSERFFLKSLESNPQDAETLAEYSYLLLICGYTKKALEVLSEAERLAPQDDLVLHFKYYFEHSLGGKKEEENVIKQYVENSSDEVQKLIKMGLTEYENNRFKRAREYFRQAFLLEPTNEGVLEMLEELDKITHFIYFPNRLFSRMHPILRFLIVPIAVVIIIVFLSIFSEFLATVAIMIFFVSYIFLAIWSWLSHPIYKYLIKRK